MSKKNKSLQIQKRDRVITNGGARKPDALIPPSSVEEALATVENLSPAHRVMAGMIPVEIEAAYHARGYVAGFQSAEAGYSFLLQIQKDLSRETTYLICKCENIDAIVGVGLDTKKLKDALSGELQDAIQSDYDNLVDIWQVFRNWLLNQTREDIGEFATANPTIFEMADSRIQALTSLKKFDDDTPLRTLKPIDPDIENLLSKVTKGGRKSVKTDLLTIDAMAMRNTPGKPPSYASIANSLKGEYMKELRERGKTITVERRKALREAIADIENATNAGEMLRKRLNP